MKFWLLGQSLLRLLNKKISLYLQVLLWISHNCTDIYKYNFVIGFLSLSLMHINELDSFTFVGSIFSSLRMRVASCNLIRKREQQTNMDWTCFTAFEVQEAKGGHSLSILPVHHKADGWCLPSYLNIHISLGTSKDHKGRV